MIQNNASSEQFSRQITEASTALALLKKEIHKAIIGQEALIQRLLIALLSDGHILIEGVPGIAKTLLINTIAKSLKLDFKRIQFTPDLLPSDLTGLSIYNPREGTFSIQKGPVFTNIVLADEINRAPPKVQSALLEVMAERQVTISGQTFVTETPFFVLATQNPIEHEGTYPLPEAVTDRFMMKVLMDYPNKNEEKEIIERYMQEGRVEPLAPIMNAAQILELRQITEQVYIDPKILNYIVDIVTKTRSKEDKTVAHLIEYGASPRASIALAKTAKAHALLSGNGFVTPHNVKEVAADVLRHRLVLSYEAEAQELSADKIVQKILESTTVP